MTCAIQVANYFINKSIPGTDENITNLKLQKLLYYAQGYYLAQNNLEQDNLAPLFDDEIQAWAHGPVVPNVYRKFSNYKFMEITEPSNDGFSGLTDCHKIFLDSIWEKFKYYSGKELEEKTHKEDPWKDIRGNLPPFISTKDTITHKSLYNYFSKITTE